MEKRVLGLQGKKKEIVFYICKYTLCSEFSYNVEVLKKKKK